VPVVEEMYIHLPHSMENHHMDSYYTVDKVVFDMETLIVDYLPIKNEYKKRKRKSFTYNKYN
jgi:hypothetical protein